MNIGISPTKSFSAPVRPARAGLLGRVLRGACAAAVVGLAPVRAQQPAAPAAAADLGNVYKEGLQAFGSGDYPTAIKDMELIISKAAADAPLETVFYTLGAAQFNAGNYGEAIKALETYVTKYPKAEKLVDATFFIGQAQLKLGDFAAAAKTFGPLESNPTYHDQILLQLGTAYKDAGQDDKAIATLKKLTDDGIRNAAAADAAMVLAGVYTKKGDSQQAIALLKAIRQNTGLLDNVIRLNAMAIEQGDTLLKADKPEEALLSYQLVQSKPEVIRLQNERLAAMQRRIDENLVAVRAAPQRAAEITTANNQLRKNIEQTKQQLAEFEKTPDFEGPLWLRIGQAYYGMDRKWEAATIYDELLRRQPEGPEREPALFGLIVASAEVNRGIKVRELADAYRKEFPNNPNANTVGYLLGASALQSGDVQAAIGYFGAELDRQPTDSTYREEISFLLGNARFSVSDYDGAAADYQKYITTYPSGGHKEEATYRKALCALFAGKYDEAVKEINAYLAAYPKGEFVADAKYRLGVCKYATSDFDGVLADADAWIKQYPSDPLLGEVLALKADAYAGQDNRHKEAVETYIASAKAAQTDEVRNHSLFEAAKILQKQGDWARIGAFLQEFVNDHPTSTAVVPAVFWIGKAKAKEGKPDEAKQIVAGVIKKNIGNPNETAVEQLITQLAQFAAKKRPAPAPSPGASPAPAPPETDSGAELDALLASDGEVTPTAKARVLFAKAELARLRKNPAEQDKNLAAIADGFKPEDLSPVLLAQAGDYLLAKGDLDRAAALFKRLLAEYPKSENVDFAYNGFGEIAYQRKDYPKALRSFTDAIDKGGASQKLKDVTIGQAKTLLAMGRLDEAKKLFEQIASTREWRGESTAYSVYSLGEIEEKKGKLAEAIAFYQRVYVSYVRFLPWVAKSYIRSAECFEKLGKKQEAINTYREMLRNDKLAGFPEFAEARKKLEALGNG